jgi:hypothetical protein
MWAGCERTSTHQHTHTCRQTHTADTLAAHLLAEPGVGRAGGLAEGVAPALVARVGQVPPRVLCSGGGWPCSARAVRVCQHAGRAIACVHVHACCLGPPCGHCICHADPLQGVHPCATHDAGDARDQQIRVP